MGSLIMHASVGEILKKKYKLSDRFMFGQLLPDLLKLSGKSRDETHYIKEYIEDSTFKKLPDILAFKEDNKEVLKNEEKLGYLCHLIEDKIWFSEYIPRYAKNDANDTDLVIYSNEYFTSKPKENFVSHLYQDYQNINGYLIGKYNIDTKVIVKMAKEVTDDEEFIKKIKSFSALTNKNMDIDKENTFIMKEDLNGFINDSVRIATMQIDKILKS